MKRLLRFTDTNKTKFFWVSICLLLFSFSSVFAQDITINKIAVENATECNQFDVTLEIVGNPPPKPQEVVLVIDRSGSMDDGPTPEPIDYAQDAAIDFVNNIFDPANNPTGLNKVALVTYGTDVTTEVSLVDSSGQTTLINAINAIVTGGWTNSEGALIAADNELINNGTFDCATSRSIVFLTDGIPTWEVGASDNCDESATSSCTLSAIQAGVNAQTTTVSGEVFDQNVFSVGLIGALNSGQTTIATSFLTDVQNAGVFLTTNNADLSGIYAQILGQLVFAAKQLPGQALVTDNIETGFSIVGGSLNPSKGTTSISGQTISWFVDEIFDETITLQYSVLATSTDVCGVQTPGTTVINYENSNCQTASEVFDNPDICIPCPDAQPSIARVGCTNDIDYTGIIDQGGCIPLSDDFSWRFLLDGNLVGTSNQLTGTFTYTGGDLVGTFLAELTYNGTYGSGCALPAVVADTSIVFPPVLEASVVVDHVECNGDSTGNIDLTVTGGTPPYTYLWSNGATTEDLSNIPAGVYNVTVTDANGCNAGLTTGATVEQPEPISIIITKENATASGACNNGSATATPSGGIPPYTYQWSASAGNQTTQTATNLPEGTHTVTVTDANNCTSQQGVVIDCFNDCDAVISVDDVVNVLCTGDTTGSATVSASSAANPSALFTFTWNTVPPQVDSGVTTSTINNLAAGVYTVSVTIDGTVCLPVEQSVTITEPSTALNVTATATDENGPTTGDGTATANPSGGTPPYTYSWSPGGETTQTITGLSAGDYTVTVTDANGCVDTATVTVNPGTCQNLSVSATSTPATCNGDADGTATANVTNGVGPFTYSWSPGGQTTQTITGLAAGSYTVTVTDQTTLCTVQSTTTVNEPSVLSSGIAITNVACFGDASGSLDLTVTGGTFPYTFLWSTGATTEDINNLTAGSYSVTITDANGCTTTNSATVQQPAAALDASFTQVDVLCNGDSTGSIDVTVTGGTPPYSYLWNTGATTQDLADIPAGTYTVVITDANNCTLTEGPINISEPSTPVSVVITKENATTAQACNDGEATANASGGTPPYTYQWSASAGNQTTQTATNLPQGTHSVVVTDANGCFIEQSVAIDCTNTCDAVISIDDVVNVLCTGDATGSATVSASSVANPGATFTFTWNTTPAQVDAGVTTSTLNNLTAGTYTVSVTIDGTVCLPVEETIIITEPQNPLSVSATATDESGPTTGDGTATASPSGGTPPYTYSWSPGGETTQTITGLSAGDYTVTVTDANGCMATTTVTVNPGTCRNLAAFASATPVTCNGDSDGTATVSVSGGSGSFTYLWNTGATTQSISGLSGGVYSVTVTDTVTLCDVTANATVNEPAALSSGIAVNNVLCFGEDTGSLDLTVTGGTAPYTFLWSNGATTEDISNLTAGAYSVTITDANGCTLADSATVQQPPSGLDISITAQTDILCGAPSSVTATATGGTAPYTYNLDGGTPQASGTFNNLAAGSYTINVLDANGCTTSVPVTILENCTEAIDDINDTFINIPVAGNVLTNDVDFEGDTQTVTTTTVTTDQGVTVTIDAVTGAYTYTPPTDYVGDDFFQYSIQDDGNPQATDTATVHIEILPLSGPDNEAPIANEDTNTTLVDTPVSGNVLVNDYDPDGDPITVTTTTVTTAQGVIVTIDSTTGAYTYTPPTGYTGIDTFEYTICDDGTPALCDSALVIITVLPNNGNITVANDDAYNTTPGMAVSGNVLDNDSDPEGDNQTVDTALSPISGPSNGTLTLNADGTFIYTPNAGFTGTDQFVYEIFDDGSPVARDKATVYVTVGGILNTTDAIDDINDTFVNVPVAGNVLTNDVDFEGDTQTVTTTTVTTAQGVTVTIDATTGAYTYTPPTDYVGEDTFQYTIVDDGNPQATDTATVYIEVSRLGDPDNDPPVANADTNTTEVDTPVSGNVLVNDYDPDGDPITVTGNTDPSNGTVTVNPDGSYTYTPNPGFEGVDIFTYTICDDGTPALCDTATVTITVIPDHQNITVANDDSYFSFINEPINGNVLDNDSDPEGDNQTVDTALTPVSGPTNGTLVINTDGTFTYTPNTDYVGPDAFVYAIFDDGTPVATDVATVYLLVGLEGNTTEAIDDINDTFVNLPVSGNVLTNDVDEQGDTQTVTTTTVVTNQGVTVNIDATTGVYTYTPPTDYVGEDFFQYSIVDDGNPQATDTATVYIEVMPIGTPDNEPPVANADTNTTEINTPVSGNVLVNDYDPDGDTIVVTTTTVTTAEGVTVTIDPTTGAYTYTPPTNFTGVDTFQYTICDDGTPVLCDTATVTITVLDDNGNITVANDDSYFGFVDTAINGNVLDNDSDPEGDNQSVDTTATPVSGPTNGTVSINADGTFTYTPNTGFFGNDEFVYEIFDDGTPEARAQATVYLTIANPGNEILAVDDINDTYVNLPVSGSVATNDENIDGPAGTEVFTLVTDVANGTLVFNADGTYTYTPNTDYVGEDTFTYQICDGGNPVACDTAVVYIEVMPIGTPDNEPPVANADTNTTEVDTPVNGNVLVNDFDPDGDPITVTGNTDPSNGTVVVNPDGTYTYTPNPGFEGEDTFEYTICDNGTPALCDTATVTIQVIPNNGNITVANDDAYNTFIDTAVSGNVLDNDNDPEGDNQSVTSTTVTTQQGITVTIAADGSFTYTPATGYTGTDQFVYAINDDGTPIANDQATVYLTIGDPGNTILAKDDINDTFVNLPVSGDVGTNDDNSDGPANTEIFTLITDVTNGTLVFNADGTYTYTPNTDYVGEDTFTYQICDGGNPVACDTAVVYIEVMPIGTPDNEPPVANADTNTTEVDTPVNGNVLVNDFDPDGDPITVTGNTDPSNGTVVVNPDGTYTYTPNPGFEGEDTFEYTICDNGTPALCDTATVTIQVIPNNGNITVANDDAYNTFIDTAVSGNVLDNDNDPEGDNQSVTSTTVTTQQGITVTIAADGSFTYTPATGYTGTDQFVYAINDDGTPIANDQATVYLTIGDPGNEILAVDDINDTYVNLPVSGSVATNDENIDGPAGTEVFTLVTDVANGTLVFNADGTYTYTPNTDYVGEDTFTYQICDGGNPVACDTAVVYIEVMPIGTPDNEPPVANADTNTTEVDTPVNGNVLVNDFDPDGDPITVTGNTDPSNGTVVVNPDGTYTYTPNPGFEGEDTFEYTICDNGTPALCDTATVTIQVIPNNGNITVANDDAYNTFIDTAVSGNVLDNDNDPEGDNQSVTSTTVTTQQGITVTIAADGSFTYTPATGYTGTDQFVYAINDDGTPIANDQATVYLTIGDPGNTILAKDDINDTFVNLPVSGDVGTNDDNSDGPANTEIFTLITDVTNGTLVFNADGTYTYTPNTDFVGEDTFTYQICDGGNPVACDTAIVTIEVIDDPIIDNDPPVANNDTAVTEVDTPVNGNVLVNDYDMDGDPITITGNTDPSNGTVVLNPDGTYTYTPNPGFEGEDAFEYTICDNGTPALCDTATVTILVIPNNGNITVANDDAYAGEVDTPIAGNVLDNDSDPEGDNQTVNTTVSPVSGPSNGTVTFNTDGSFTYTPNAGYIGTDQMVYSADDDGAPQASDQATVYFIIRRTPAPAIAIVKTGTYMDTDQDQCADAGETIGYVFTVTNQGNVPLGNVTVTDPLLEAPNPVVPIVFETGDTNNDGMLDVDETWSYVATYTVTQDDIDAGQVTNQATAEGTDPDGTTVSDLSDDELVTEDDPTVISLCQSSVIAIVKEALLNDENQDNCTDPGETIDYTFTVTNEGNTSLSNITVTDPLLEAPNPVVPIVFASGDTDGDGELDVTETWVYTASYAVTQDDIDAGEVINQATATGTTPSGATVDDLSDDELVTENDPTVTDLCQQPVIAIVKTGVFVDGDQDQCSDPGEAIDYTFTVTNEGNVSLSNITVTDPLLEAPNPVVPIVFVSGDTDNDGELDVTETWVYTASYAITQIDIDAGQVENQATATGTAPDTTVVNDLSDDELVTENDPTVTDLCQNPVIAIVKTGLFVDGDGDNCADPGEAIDYTFTVTNEGNVSLGFITVTDPLLEAPNPIVPIVFVSGDTDGDGELDVTETWIYTASYAVTQDDIDAGQVTNQASVLGTSPANVGVTDLSDDEVVTENDPTVTDLCQQPVIAIVKTGVFVDGDGDNCADPGEAIDYTFTITNEGNVSLSNITVTDPLLEAPNPVVPIILVSGDVDGDSELDVDETWIYTASYAVTQDDIDAGQVTNQATATGTAPDTTVVDDLSDDEVVTENDPTVTDLCQEPAIAIVKTASYDDGGDCSQPGETIDYTFEVSNQGNVSLSNISVDDPLLGGPVAGPDSGDTDGDGELDVDEVWIYTGSYAITQTDIDNGEVLNQATAEGTAPDGTVVDDESGATVDTDETTTTDLCQEPAIAIVKTASYDDGGDCSQPGETIDYTFEVSNQGNVSLSNISVDDPLLGGPVAGPDSGDTDGDGELDVDEVWIYTGSYAITQTDIDNGEVLNQATAEGTAPDGTVVDDESGATVDTDETTTTDLCQEPAIAIVKTASYDDGGDCSQPGETIDYTFEVSNQGNVSLSNISVDDPLLGGPVAGPDSGDTDGDGELDVDEVWIYTGSYTITQGDIDNGEVLNQATAEGTAPDGTVVDDESGATVDTDETTTTDLCQEPAIAIVKTASYDDGGDCSQPGETIDYTFEVSNQGNVSLSNISVDDPLLGGPVAGPDSGDTDGDNELDVDEVWVYTGSYTITQGDIDNGEVLNQATAEGTAPDGTVVDDESGATVDTDETTTTDLCQEPAIAIVKTASYDDGGDCSQPGETIDYTFEVSNQGNVSLSNISVDDPLLGGPVAGPDSGDTDGDGELDVDEVWIYTGSYTITQGDIDNGEVLNQATAEGTAPDGTVVDDESGATVDTDETTTTDLCQEPAIAIVKTASYDDGGDCSQPGETIDYTFEVSNQGNVSLSSISVDDPLLGGPVAGPDSGDTDGDGELDVDEVWIYTGSYTITQGDIDNGEVLNQATAEGTAPDGTVVDDLSGSTIDTNDTTDTDLCQDASIALIKTGVVTDTDGDKCADTKETIEYSFEVINTGNVTINNIDVEDPLVNVIGGPISLDPGQSDTTTFTASYIILQGDIDAGQVENQATVTGETVTGDTVTDLSDDNSPVENDPTITPLCQDAVIALIKVGTPTDEDDNGCIDLGETIVYDFVVTNLGNVELTNVIVTDPLVAVSGGPVTILAGESDTETFTAIYTVTQEDVDNGFISNQATAEGTAPDGSVVTDLSDDNSVLENDPTISTLCQNPMLSLEKTGVFNDDNGDQIPQVGETITYTFSVENTGDVTLYNITIQDPLPGVVIEGGPIDVLDVGEIDSTTFTGTYQITQEDIDNGEVINQALATGEDQDGNEVEDDSDDPTDITNTDNDGDGDPDDPTITDIPNVGGAQFEIFNGVTPNGDGLNDFFEIRGISDYPNNNVKIFNRWGVLVWETNGYDEANNVFRGRSSARATISEDEELPTGTYFYVLTFSGETPEGQSAYNGYLYINR